jgi:GR25 family glycosyltransferase involved in LPS biosynthesis
MKALCLNLDSRPDRWDNARIQFKRVGLEVERFPAIPHENPFISFNLSQQAILQTITSPTWVFEDDVLFVNTKRWTDVIGTIPDGWDMLYLGGNVTDNLQHHSQHWWRCVGTFTTHAVIYTPKAAQYILERFDPMVGVYDAFLLEQIQLVLNCYICKPFLAVQSPGYSDLWGRETDYGLLDTQNKLK